MVSKKYITEGLKHISMLKSVQYFVYRLFSKWAIHLCNKKDMQNYGPGHPHETCQLEESPDMTLVVD